jgi:YidC/Oxa1 family membrane protein insertase
MSTPQPSPRSNLMQILLIFAVIYLGMLLLFPPNRGPQLTLEEMATRFEKAQTSQEIIQTGKIYAQALRRNGKIEDARAVELKVAQSTLQQARDTKEYSYAIQAKTELEALIHENPNDPISQQAKTYLQQTVQEGAELAKTGGTGMWSGFVRMGYLILDFLVRITGKIPAFSYWFAALFLAIVVRLAMWPLTTKQIMSFKKMAQLQPLVKELQEKYQGQELQIHMMKLYERYGVNPWAGCWPMLLQLPILIWMYACVRAYQFEFEKGTFLWINPEWAKRFPGIVAPNLGEKDIPLVLLYGISMIATMWLSASDPNNLRQSRIMGIVMSLVFTVMMLFWNLPSAFILYWSGFNVIATIQSLVLNRMPVPPLQEVTPGSRKDGLFSGLIPKEGPKGPSALTDEKKTGAPVLHKPKGNKSKKRKRK